MMLIKEFLEAWAAKGSDEVVRGAIVRSVLLFYEYNYTNFMRS